jgi:polyhydroxyalkanoate synthesis regulator phasin
MSLLKNTALASIGLFEVTKARAEKIVDELIKRGELSRSNRKQAVLELVEKAEKSTSEFRRKVLQEADQAREAIEKLAKDLNWARQTEVSKLEAKVNKLGRTVKKLQEEADTDPPARKKRKRKQRT